MCQLTPVEQHDGPILSIGSDYVCSSCAVVWDSWNDVFADDAEVTMPIVIGGQKTQLEFWKGASCTTYTRTRQSS